MKNILVFKYLFLVLALVFSCETQAQDCVATLQVFSDIIQKNITTPNEKNALQRLLMEQKACFEPVHFSKANIKCGDYLKKKYEKNIDSLNTALQLYEKAFYAGINTIEQNTIYKKMASVYFKKSSILEDNCQNDEALKMYQKTDSCYLLITNDTSANTRNNHTAIKQNMINLYNDVENIPEAKRLVNALLKQEHIRKFDKYEELLRLKYDIYAKENNKKVKKETLAILLAWYKNTKNTLGEAFVYNYQAYDALIAGDLNTANDLLDVSEKIFKSKKNDIVSLEYAEYWRNKAKWSYETHDYTMAATCLDTVFELVQNYPTKDIAFLLKAKSLKAKLFAQQKNYTAAVHLQKEILAQDSTICQTKDLQHCYHWRDLGEIYTAAHNPAAATICFKQALSIAKNFGYGNAMIDIPIFQALCGALIDQNKLEVAQTYVDSLTLFFPKEMRNTKYDAMKIMLQGRLAQAQKDFAKATNAYKKAIGILEEEYVFLQGIVSEQEQANLQTAINSLLQQFYTLPNDILQKESVYLYGQQLKNKAILLHLYQEQQGLRDKLAAENPKIKELQDSLRSTKQKYINADKEDWAAIRIEIRNIERALNKQLPKILKKSNLIEKDVKRQLATHEAAIEIITFPDAQDTTKTHYAALLLTKNSKTPKMVVLPTNGKEMDGKYWKEYDKKIRNEDLNFEAAQQIYWQPIADALGSEVQTVWFSPDGVYHKINLALLGAKGKRVSDVYDLHIVATTRSIAERNGKADTAPQKGRAVLFGNPDYKAAVSTITDTSTVLSYPNERLQVTFGELKRSDDERGCCQSLKGAEKEVRNIAALLQQNNWQTDTFLLAKATEAELRRTVKPTVLHIATHAGYLVKNTNGYTDALQTAWLHLAGAQAWVNQPDSVRSANAEGVLIGSEAALLDLQGTELVVLSACETGRGTVRNAEGVYGLQRAFRMAGAKAVLSTLWKVDDTATQLFMTAFYTEWLHGNTSKQAALRKAQQTLQSDKRYDKPFYWGAFVLLE